MHRKFELSREDISIEKAYDHLFTSLEQYFDISEITETGDGFNIEGNLKGLFERALTDASLELRTNGKMLSCEVTGTVRFGKWPWVWLLVGLFTGVAIGVFLGMLASYLLSKSKPKACFENAFETLEFKMS